MLFKCYRTKTSWGTCIMIRYFLPCFRRKLRRSAPRHTAHQPPEKACSSCADNESAFPQWGNEKSTGPYSTQMAGAAGVVLMRKN